MFLFSLEPPLITNRPSQKYTVAEGSTLIICCKATGSPAPRLQWLRADQPSDSTLAFQENKCLKFNPVKVNNDGDYICRATNSYGLAETTTTVSVTFSGKFEFCMKYSQTRVKPTIH